MCRSMVDIQSPTAEIRRGKKKRKNEDRNHRAKTWAQFTGRQLRQCISSGYPWTCDSWLTSYDHCLSSAHLLWYSQTGVDTHRQVILTDRWYSQTGDTHRQVREVLILTDRCYSGVDTHRDKTTRQFQQLVTFLVDEQFTVNALEALTTETPDTIRAVRTERLLQRTVNAQTHAVQTQHGV